MTWLGPGAAWANTGDLDLLLQNVPNGPVKTGKANGYTWVEYCPDETCDVLRTRKRIQSREIKKIALAHLLYLSDYSYLQDWKSDIKVKAEVDEFLTEEMSDDCRRLSGKDGSICVLRRLTRKFELEFIFVRYDEKKAFVKKIPLQQIFK